MTTQYTTLLKLALPVQGELSGTWGTVVNENITEMIEEAIAGLSTINSWTTNSHVLTTADGTTAESRAAILELADDGLGNPSAAATVICPALSKIYIVKNGCGQTATIKTSAGTGVAIPDGDTALVYCDGTNVVTGSNFFGNIDVDGGTIDGVTLGTNSAITEAQIDNININGNAIISTDTNGNIALTPNGTGEVDISKVDIDSGTIDGTIIGANSAAAGTFTTLTTSSTISGTDMTITTIEATNYKANDGTAAMTIADTTGVVTISTELNVDNINISGNSIISTDTNGNIALTPNGTGEVDISKVDIDAGAIDGTTIGAASAAAGTFTNVTATGTINFTGATVSDLGSVTTVAINGGTIDGTTIGGTTPAAGSFTTGQFGTNLNVDGTVTADGLTVDGAASIDGASGIPLTLDVDAGGNTNIQFNEGSALRWYLRSVTGSNDFNFYGNGASRLNISSGGDISFYDSGGSSQSFFWDASAEALGIGTTGPATVSGGIHAVHDATEGTPTAVGDEVGIFQRNFNSAQSVAVSLISGSASTSNIYFGDNGDIDAGKLSWSNSNNSFSFSGGNVGIGTSSPTSELTIGADTPQIDFYKTSSADVLANIRAETDAGSGGKLVFQTKRNGDTALDRMTIDDDGSFLLSQGTGNNFRVIRDGDNIIEIGNFSSTDGYRSTNYFSSTHTFYVATAGAGSGSRAVDIDSSGNVGINTSNPGFKFEVVGTVGLNTSGTSVLATLGANNNTDKYIRVRNSDGNFEVGSAAGGHYLYGNGTLPLQFFTNATQRMQINSSGALKMFNSNSKETDSVRPSGWGYAPSAYGVTIIGDDDSTGGTVSIGFDPSVNTDGTFSGYGSEMIFPKTIVFYQSNSDDTAWLQPFKMAPTEVVVNEAANDLDFRVESVNNPYMLFVDANTDNVGINTSTPGAMLDVTGGDARVINTGGGAVAKSRVSTNNQTDAIVSARTTDSNGTRTGFMANGYPDASYADTMGRDDTDFSAIGWMFYTLNSTYESQTEAKLKTETTAGTEFSLITASAYSGVTINEDNGSDIDFTVESLNNSRMLFVDAGNDRVGIGTSSTSGMLTVGNDNATRAYSDRVRTEWNSIFGVTENTHYQRFKLTADAARKSAYVKVTIQPHSGGGISSMSGATLEGSIWRADGGAQFDLTLINNGAWGAGGVSLSEPVVSGNDVIFGIVVGNNGTGSTYDVACKVELIGNTDDSFTYSEITGTTAATGTNPGIGHYFYINNSQVVGMDNGGTVVNESDEDRDFRVESVNKPHALFVDADADNIIFGSNNGNNMYDGGAVNPGIQFELTYGTIVHQANGNANYYMSKASGYTNGTFLLFNVAGSAVGSITTDGSSTTYNTTSDRRLKTDIQPIANGTEKLMAMKPVSHKWIADPEADAVHGFIAQEMQDIVPEAVSGDPDGEEMMSMDYGRITPVLVAALQEAHKKIEALEKRLSELEEK